MSPAASRVDMRIWQHAIDNHITDVMQPDVMYMGGLTPDAAGRGDGGG